MFVFVQSVLQPSHAGHGCLAIVMQSVCFVLVVVRSAVVVVGSGHVIVVLVVLELAFEIVSSVALMC